MALNWKSSQGLQLTPYPQSNTAQKPVFDPAEWQVVPTFVAFLPLPPAEERRDQVRFTRVWPAPEIMLPLNFPEDVKKMLWDRTLPISRIIRLNERPPRWDDNGTELLQSPVASFCEGFPFRLMDHANAVVELGFKSVKGKYTAIDLIIPTAVDPAGTPARDIVPVNAKIDTIIIKIKNSTLPRYLDHITLSAIQHVAIEFANWPENVSQGRIAQRVTQCLSVAIKFPMLRSLRIIIGKSLTRDNQIPIGGLASLAGQVSTTWNDVPGPEMRFLEVDDNFLEMEATKGRIRKSDPLGEINTDNFPHGLKFGRRMKRIADTLRQQFDAQIISAVDDRYDSLQSRNLELNVSMMAWFDGTSRDPRETNRVYLEPVNPQYSGVAYYCDVPKGPVNIDQTVGEDSHHWLSFRGDIIDFVMKANPDGTPFTKTDYLEDIRTLFPDSEDEDEMDWTHG